MTDSNTHNALGDFCTKDKFIKNPNNPLTEAEFQWLFKNRDSNGFASAFVRVHRRKFLIDIPEFIKCLESRKGG